MYCCYYRHIAHIDLLNHTSFYSINIYYIWVLAWERVEKIFLRMLNGRAHHAHHCPSPIHKVNQFIRILYWYLSVLCLDILHLCTTYLSISKSNMCLRLLCRLMCTDMMLICGTEHLSAKERQRVENNNSNNNTRSRSNKWTKVRWTDFARVNIRVNVSICYIKLFKNIVCLAKLIIYSIKII